MIVRLNAALHTLTLSTLYILFAQLRFRGRGARMSSSDSEEFACAALVVACQELKKKRRRKWTNDWLQRREDRGSYGTLFCELKEEDNLFTKYMRLSLPLFEFLSSKIEGTIAKQDTPMRNAIPAAARLECTLLYLITGLSYSRLTYFVRISQPCISAIVPETCKAIYDALKDDYLEIPRSPEEWKDVAEGFFKKWNFPNCIGAVDGKHVQIEPPPNSGSFYYNYKGTHSIVLMAVSNANYEFIYVDVGANGRVSDGGVWANCSLSKLLEDSRLDIPSPSSPLNSSRKLPYVMVADDAFPLKNYILKPSPFRQQTERQRIFSYRLSRARRVVENSFGIMANRFRIMQTAIPLSPNKVTSIVLACVVLHNFLRVEFARDYFEGGTLDREAKENGFVLQGTWRDEPTLTPLQATAQRHPSESSKAIREAYCDYFNNEGQVAWQKRMTGLED